MKYSQGGFPYKTNSPNKFLGKALRGAAKGIGGLVKGVFGGGSDGAATGARIGAGGGFGVPGLGAGIFGNLANFRKWKGNNMASSNQLSATNPTHSSNVDIPFGKKKGKKFKK